MKLSELVKSGKVPQVKPLGPARFEGHTLNIDTASIQPTHDLNTDADESMDGYVFNAYDLTDGESIRFTTQSKSLVQQIREQFMPYIEEIGPELTVTVISEPSKRRVGGKVFRFV